MGSEVAGRLPVTALHLAAVDPLEADRLHLRTDHHLTVLPRPATDPRQAVHRPLATDLRRIVLHPRVSDLRRIVLHPRVTDLHQTVLRPPATVLHHLEVVALEVALAVVIVLEVALRRRRTVLQPQADLPPATELLLAVVASEEVVDLEEVRPLPATVLLALVAGKP